MAGTMIHLLVAEKLIPNIMERAYCFDRSIRINRDYFIAGNICPDGIMARKNYIRSMKLHSHFRDGIPDGAFEKEGMVPIFEDRMRCFWESHGEDEKETPGLYLGYITHMMTDEKFILEERPRFFENIARIGLTQEQEETFSYFNKETDLVDFMLLRNYTELQRARQSLERVGEYEIKGMISKQELTDSRQWILEHFFREFHTQEEPRFLSYGSMEHFIEETVENISERLLTEGYLLE